MSLDNKPNTFFDKNTLVAIALSFGIFFFWQMYVSKKYPAQPKEAVQQSATDPNVKGAPAIENSSSAKAAAQAAAPAVVPAPTAEQVLKFESPEVNFEVSSVGMGLKNLTLNKYLDRRNEPIHYSTENNLPLATTTVNDLKNYSLSKISDTQFRGVLTDNNITVVKTLTVEPKKYMVSIKVETKAINKQKINVSTFLNGQIEVSKKSFLLPSYEHQEFFVEAGGKKERTALDPETPVKSGYENVSLASFNSHYFSLLLANRNEDIFPAASVEVAQGQGSVDLKYQTAQPVDAQELNFDFYFGPKDMDVLKSIDPEFKEVIDYGFFSFIGRPLLWLLKFLQTMVNNWGVSIILLTLILRVVLLPINLYSFKAMRRMQLIQPKLKDIKEKYKNDPARMNQETLLVMKREKANPLSGCIPALMQIPIFFALYAVLGKSIELYREPFFFWIQDLSLKDPFFILPILVGATFFVQQKVTPAATMDPTQQKVLLFMPLIFSVFMLSTPSGLTLYMFVNGLFGVGQQILFTKNKGGALPDSPQRA